MKKTIYIIIFIVFLFVMSSHAQIYSINPSFDSLQANTLAMVNSSTSGNVTTAKIKYIVNKSIGEVCDAFPAIEKVDTVVIDRDSTGSALNADFLRIKQVFRIDQTGDAGGVEIWTPISHIPFDSLAILFDTKGKNEDELGDVMDLLVSYTWNRKLKFQPKNYAPTASPDSFVVYYYARDTFLVAGADSTVILPEYMTELMNFIQSEIKALQEDYLVSDFYMRRANASAVTPKPREVDLKR